MEPYASIIIPTRNGIPLFERCLESVFAQVTPWPFEVIVIDSGSKDGTLVCAHSHGAVTVQIPPGDFNHGTTRNLGLQSARGTFLVFLVQDAIPADEHWLATLVSACEADGIAGSYSRQIVRTDSDLITHYLCRDAIPSDENHLIKRLPLPRRLCDLTPRDRFDLALFQNASSCVRRRIFLDHQFARLPYGEDIEWGKRMIEAGYGIVYEPRSRVYHSHDRPPVYTLRRAYADHFQASELFGLREIPSVLCALRTVAAMTFDSLRFAARKDLSVHSKLKFALAASQHITCLILGEFLGPTVQEHFSTGGWPATLDRLLRKGV